MQFITTDQRIAVENFEIGLIYTVTFTGGRYFSGACIGKGADFVMFQRTAPDLVFCLNMTAAADVESIEQTSGGGGTLNYNELYNKPQINGTELSGNKSLDNLGIQAKLTFDSAPTEDSENPVESGGVYGALAGKQDTISDLSSIRSGAAAGATAVQPADVIAALATKQDVLTTEQLAAVNSGVTSMDVEQIETNKNNILSIYKKIGNNLVNSVSGSGTRWINIEVDLPAGNYTCGFSSLTGDDSGASQITFYGADYSIIQPDRKYIGKGTNVYINNITITDTAKTIRIYAANDSTASQNKNVSYTNLFICEQEAWNASVGVQPYAPSNAELYAMIQSLQAQLANQ